MIKTRIRHKRDTVANWTAENPILLNGEIAIVDDGNSTKLKIGDGSTAYNSLPFYVSEADLNNATGVIPIANGGTGATTASKALSNLGAAPSSHSHSSLNVYASNESNIANGHTGGSLYINYRGVNEAITDYLFCDGKGNTLATLSELKTSSPFTSRATSIGGASTTVPAVVVTTYRSGNTWYRKWSDGFVEQGGVVSIARDTVQTVTLPTAFSHANYFVTAIEHNTSRSDEYAALIGTRSTTSIQIKNTMSTTLNFGWYACG